MDFVPSLERDRRPISARDADVFRASGCAECLTGPARLIDGDTIVVADQLVRLHRCPRTRRSGGTRIYPPPTGSDLCHPGPYGWAFDTWAAIRRVDKAWRGGRPPDHAGSQGRRVPPKVPTSRQHQGETLGRPGCPVLAIDPFQRRVTETKPPDRAQWWSAWYAGHLGHPSRLPLSSARSPAAASRRSSRIFRRRQRAAARS
jgi:hypothetical protein